MKKNYTLALLFVMSGLLRLGAQSLTATQTNFDLTVKPTEAEAGIETYVKNNSSTTVTLKWTRTVTCTSDPIWSSYICDPNLCYGDATSQAVQDIILAPGQEGLFTFHVKPNGTAGNGEYRIKIYEKTNVDNNIELVIKANGAACSSSTVEPSVADIEIAPNPAYEHFRLIDAETITGINMMTLDGRQICHFEASPGQTYHVGGYPTGIYILALQDRTGRTVRVMQLKKQ